MARRFRYPTHVPRGMSAEEENEQERAKNLATNQANIYRPPGVEAPDPSREIQRKLALAFGYDPADPPPLKQLIEKYHQQPSEVRSGIFQKGAAPISLGEGMKGIQNVAKNTADRREQLIDMVGDKFIKGDIVHDPATNSFHEFETEEIPDPLDPTRTKKIKKKVPVSVGTGMLVKDAVNRGRIPNPVTGEFATDAKVLAPEHSAQSRMSAEAFQQILDARQAGILEPSKLMEGTDFMQSTNPVGMAPQTMGLMKGTGYGMNSGIEPNTDMLGAGVKYNPLNFNPNTTVPPMLGPEKIPKAFAQPGTLPGFDPMRKLTPLEIWQREYAASKQQPSTMETPDLGWISKLATAKGLPEPVLY